ncbi:SGNH/GDSL hydrolase family protein [Kribbella sp. NPDC048928]|uniref:SGNH/GDSL hydrolase family protein n=1 Tax=Kribbella sp. NPDC048928 TaxID=3364111 RepID=UPI003714A203
MTSTPAGSVAGRLATGAPLTWLFTGDSVTAGEQHTYGHRDFSQLFEERIRYELGRGTDTVVNTAKSGWTADVLARMLDHAVLRWNPDLVIVGLGLNDCHDGEAGRDRFRMRYADVVDRIIAAGAHPVLQTPNGVLPSSPEARTGALPGYAEDIRALATARGCTLIDHQLVWTRAERATQAWISEGCHPNGYGHIVMAHTLLRSLGLFDPRSHLGRLHVPYGDLADGAGLDDSIGAD